MERKANYVIVGFFTLVCCVSLGFFVFWIGKYGMDGGKYYDYKSSFSESVTGLKYSSPIKLNGIDVGFVEAVSINTKNPELVDVDFKIEKSVPIRSNAVVVLSAQGVAGIGYLELKVGSNNAKSIVSPNTRVCIPSEMSQFSKVLIRGNAIVAKTEAILSKVDTIASQQNIDNLSMAINNFANASNEVTKSVKSAHGVLDETKKDIVEARVLMSDIRQDVTMTTENVNSLLYQSKKLVGKSNNVVESLKDSPSDILFKSKRLLPGPGEE